MINSDVTISKLLLVTPQTITHMENSMNRLLGKLKTCDGYFCEQVSIAAVAVITVFIMYLSIAQI